MKYFFLIIFLIIFKINFAQNPINIIEVKDRVVKIDENFENIIEFVIKYDNNEIKTHIDTLFHYDSEKIKNVKKFKYWIDQNIFYTQNCYYFKNIKYCSLDSLPIYFPITIQGEYSRKKMFDDTAICLIYFYFFSKANEKSLISYINNAYRITILADTVFEIFTINKDAKITLNYKKFRGFYNYFQGIVVDTLIENKKIEINIQDYSKIKKYFDDLNLLSIEPKYTVLPVNILIEGFVDGKYNFFVLNDAELKSKKYKLLAKNFQLFYKILQNKN